MNEKVHTTYGRVGRRKERGREGNKNGIKIDFSCISNFLFLIYRLHGKLEAKVVFHKSIYLEAVTFLWSILKVWFLIAFIMLFWHHSIVSWLSLLTLGILLALPLSSNVTLGKSLNHSLPHFLIWKVEETIDLPPRVLWGQLAHIKALRIVLANTTK